MRDLNRAGFTLVELLLAMMLTSVGLMAMARVFVVANQHAAFAKEETEGSLLAQEIREKIMAADFKDIYSVFNGIDTNNPSTVPAAAAVWAQNLHDRLGTTGRGTVAVSTNVQDHSIPYGIDAILVTITWKERTATVTLPLHFDVAKIEM